MKTIYQDPEELECAAACLAMLADIDLKDARRALFGNGDAKRVGRKKLLAALSKFGRKPRSSDAMRISAKHRLRDLKNDAIVFGAVRDSTGKEDKHWLVWDHRAGTLRDPLGFVEALKVTSYTELL